jgi:DNA polymerase-3 subunit delta'
MPFQALVGHRPTLTLLARASASSTLPPSLILAGPEGVGKRRAALALAEILNCLAPLEGGEFAVDACGACAACRRIARLIHPDVSLVVPGETGSIKIDPVREEIRKTAFKPFEGRRRVIVFDDADALTEDAQDALLKTLEEPPAGTVLVLVTSQPDRLLPTVRSRCPVIRFGPLPPADVARWLMEVEGVDEPRARAVAAVTGGSLARARVLARDGVEETRETAARVLTTLSGARDPRQRLEAAQDLIGRGKGTGARERESLAAHLHALAALVRDLLALTSGAAVGNSDMADALGRLAPAFGADRAVAAFATLTQAIDALEKNASPKIVADWVAIRL